MKLFLIAQSQNSGFETYDGAVVAAPNEETAKFIDPRRNGELIENWKLSYWCNSPEKVEVTYLGETAENIPQGVILASYNAG